MKKRDYYDVLGVARGASDADVKKAYRRLARKLHPDVNPGDKTSQKRFQEVQEAYDVLKDGEKRRAYDRFGHAASAPGFDPGAASGGFGGGGGGPFSNVSFESTDFADLFGNIFGGSGRFRTEPEKGEPAYGTIEVDFREAVLGGTASLALRREKTCPTCGGTGQVAKSVCPTCRGAGRVPESERVRIRIPEGTADGGTIRIPGKGGAGLRGGEPGDLFVTVRVRPHSYFERVGDDIHGTVPITVKEAYTGAEIDVPTIHGTVRAKIPPGTQGRQRFRLRGKGAKSPKTGETGDHLYTVRIMVPTTRPPAGVDAATLLESLYEKPVREGLPKGL
ncbi:MAG TPA: J domain-containing protein [Thermoanaerobaculia bacterium]|nr:J domain-containing protein [Thermoanaerobaculia bacterium]